MKDTAIGKRIQQYREAKGYTQEAFAEIIKLTPNYLSALERGVKTPSLDTLIEIINSLDASADEILMDVIKAGYKTRASKLSEVLGDLPQDEQRRILTVVEVLVKEAKSR